MRFRLPVRVAATICTFGATILSAAAGMPQAATPNVQPEAEAPRYMRTVEAGDVANLEVSVRTLVPVEGKGPVVQLVGVIHVADKAYYDALQKYLDERQLVLYEGVKPGGVDGVPEGANADEAAKVKVTRTRQRLLALLVERHKARSGAYPADFEQLLAGELGTSARLGKAATVDGWGAAQALIVGEGGFDIVSLGADGREGGEGGNADLRFSEQPPLTREEKSSGGEGLQVKLARAMGLEFQLVAIDYNRPNWRNSDMTIDEVEAELEKSGASGGALFSMLDGSGLTARLAGFFLSMVERSPQLSAMMKLMMLETVANADKVLDSQTGPMAGLMKVILIDRNEAVLRDLQRIIADEPEIREVALFYGAGHMNHLEERLTRDFGYRFEKDEWFPAISIDMAKMPGGAAEARRTRESIRVMVDQQMRSAEIQAEREARRAERRRQREEERRRQREAEAQQGDGATAPAPEPAAEPK